MSDYVHVDQHYVPHVERARERARRAPSLSALLFDEVDARTQLGFLIEFCALGVRLLRPAEDSLRRGVEVCLGVGLDSIAAELDRLGKEAADRRLLLIDDFVQLAQLWREQAAIDSPALDLGALVRRPQPAAALRHAATREAACADPLPLALLGVELELGRFALDLGPRLIRACERKLGPRVFAGLTYLQARAEHAALGSDELLGCLDELLWIAPEYGESIALAGADALAAHVAVLEVCLARGRRLVRADGATDAVRSFRV
ncbi:hypothetical protein ENSA5_25190 [Enhygromyxa salina]|uniref:Uncharacterized protein n=1 Tax=Enhygromyxa salina TaxID=215803 RepID=A0A2S9YB07_9BACT|nr:hypothetical protein [Enhygromyxa salina]PRQ02283.1 hypothetical protein ENSA5_25190 [Enhygromyxa salina]